MKNLILDILNFVHNKILGKTDGQYNFYAAHKRT